MYSVYKAREERENTKLKDDTKMSNKLKQIKEHLSFVYGRNGRVRKALALLALAISEANKARGETEYELGYYLSTHTFYGSEHKRSTKVLQSCGFDIEIDNWDKEQDND